MIGALHPAQRAGRHKRSAAPMLCLGYNETCGFWGLFARLCLRDGKAHYVGISSPAFGNMAAQPDESGA